MSKVSTLFTIALLISFVLTQAARPGPSARESLVEAQHGDVKETAKLDDSCEGEGKEECLARRTLSAQLDYIYTQKQPKQKP